MTKKLIKKLIKKQEEDSKVQTSASPKPRRRRQHMLSSDVKPVSREPSESALNMAKQPPAEKPIRTAPTPETLTKDKEQEEDVDDNDTAAVVDAH